MSNDYAVEIKNVHKTYKLYKRPIDRLKETLNPFPRNYHHEFSALENVSIAIRKGESVGIIGKNGSGKSTLLKILTGVLNVTKGEVKIVGKVSALLELGAGFNPEFTGMENIFLNGLILGFSKEAISKKIEEILDFADIGEFIDQPVKMYSSGMYVRLAFAIAVIASPDILIVDEALAVGDIRFQQKCLRKMRDIQTKGCTVIFVSHDVGIINNFCERTIWLDRGEVRGDGPSAEVTKRYSAFMSYDIEVPIPEPQISSQRIEPQKADWSRLSNIDSFGDGGCEISCYKFLNKDNCEAVNILSGGENVELSFLFQAKDEILRPGFGILIKDRLGNSIFGINNYIYDISIPRLNPGSQMITFCFQMPLLSNGRYSISVAVSDGDQNDHIQKIWLHDCVVFSVENLSQKFKLGTVLVLEKAHMFLTPQVQS